ncbi:hypothetical protein K2X89_04890 [Myxococcota bacterium]|nr:hypothetical protein [Myxococcota bacterium]
MKSSVPRARPIEAPARARFWPVPSAGPWSALQIERLELVSRGDLVSGLRISDRDARSAPEQSEAGLLVLVHDAGGDARSMAWSPVARWLHGSARTVAIALDLPLHGPRTSAKLSERLVASLAIRARGAELDRNGAVLVEEFLTQSVHDLRRTLDAMLGSGEIDRKRVALIGIGIGALVADALLVEEDRVRAAVMVRTLEAPAPRGALPEDTRTASPSPSGLPTSASAATPTADRLELDVREGRDDWAPAAHRFLASRIGF